MAYPTDHIDINRGTTGLTLTPEQSNEIIAKAVEQSAVMQLAERVSLPGSGLSIPVITGEPVADFVAETAEKPVSNATFSTKTMTPYKIAVIEMFSMEFRRDFRRLYDELIRRLPAALATKFDATVFFGTAPGTGFDVLTSAADEDIETDSYAGLVAAYGDIATNNYRPTGFALSPAAAAGGVEGFTPALYLDCRQFPPLKDHEVFRALGVRLLDEASWYPFALLDELGGYELIIPEFRTALERLLGSGLPCVGALRSAEDAELLRALLGLSERYPAQHRRFLDTLRRDGDTRLFELREDNVDDARRLLARWAAEYAG